MAKSRARKDSSQQLPTEADKCFRGCLYFAVGRLYRLIDRLASETFGRIKMSASHGYLLMALADAKGKTATPSELAATMNLDPSTVTRLIEQLEKSKLVKRHREGRNIHIHLLAAGQERLADVRACWRDLGKAYNEALGESNAEALNECLYKSTKEIRS